MDRKQHTPDRRRDRGDDRGWRETERDTGRGMRHGERHAYRPGEPGYDRYDAPHGHRRDERADRDPSRHYASEAGPGHGRDTYDRGHDSRSGYAGERRASPGDPERGDPAGWNERFGQGGRGDDEIRRRGDDSPWDDPQRVERRSGERMEPDWEVDRYDRATLHGNADRDRFGGRGEHGRSVAPRQLDEGRMELGGARPARGFTDERERGPYRGHGPKGYRRSDERIREDVCDALTEHPDLDASDCSVTVDDGEVTLEGRVDSRPLKHLAENLACACSGVVDVHNHLRVRRRDEARSNEERGDDEANGGDRSNGRHYQGAGSGTARSR